MTTNPPSPRQTFAGRYEKYSDGVPCMCGKRPGQHRWGDNACPNPHWRTSNGLPQWLERTFYRPNTPTPPRALGGN